MHVGFEAHRNAQQVCELKKTKIGFRGNSSTWTANIHTPQKELSDQTRLQQPDVQKSTGDDYTETKATSTQNIHG